MENVVYKTHEPASFWLKFGAMYYCTLKRYRLVELRITDNIIYIATEDGKSLTAPVDKIKVRYLKDKYHRLDVKIKYEKESIHFILVPYTLEDTEIEEIEALLQSIRNSDEHILGKAQKVMNFIKDCVDVLVG